MTADSPTYSQALPISAGYASMWAGAHYRPIPHLPASHPRYGSLTSQQQRFQSQLANEYRLATHTARIMKHLARASPEAGIEIMPGIEYLETPPPENIALKSGDVYAGEDDRFRVYTSAEMEALNKRDAHDGTGQIKWACEYETYVVNVHIYCAWLLQQFLQGGGKTAQKHLKSIGEALHAVPEAACPIIVNCSGTGLWDDPKMKVIRGQTVLVRNQYHSTITRQCADGTWSFLIPRPLGGGTVVGGTKQVSDSETCGRPEERLKLLENAVKYFPDFVSAPKDFDVVQDVVGRRPWREGGMRIEMDELKQDGVKLPVVHAYGAGGRGYELSWGAAEQVCELVGRYSRLQPRL